MAEVKMEVWFLLLSLLLWAACQDAAATQEEQTAILRELADTVHNLQKDMQSMKDKLNNGYLNPFQSCWQIAEAYPSAKSGYYWVQDGGTGQTIRVYCNMDSHCCNSTSGWMRIANVDMTDPTQQCPPEFILKRENGVRVCGRKGEFVGCTSTTFSSHGIEYDRVCGRIRAYQFGSPDAFFGGQESIDEHYVDGISITHGSSPRKHIWTFAAAFSEAHSDRRACPCTQTDQSFTGRIPLFVGNDYFCETAVNKTVIDDIDIKLFSEDPLWDGQGCGPTSSCCSFNNPPWFCTQLPQPTTDDIELRMCGHRSTTNEDTPFDQIELYIQNEDVNDNTNIESLISKVDSLRDKTNSLAATMDSLSTRTDSLTLKVNSLSTRSDSLVSKVDSLNSSLTSKVDSLSTRSDSLTSKVDSLSTRSDSLTSKVDSLSTRSDSLTSKVDSLSIRSDSLTSKVDSLSTRSDSLASKVVSKVDSLNSSLTSKVDSLSTRSDSLTSKVDSLSTRSDSLTSKVDSLSTRSDSLASKVDSFTMIAESVREEQDSLKTVTVAVSERVESLHDKADIQTRKLTNITHNVVPIKDSTYTKVIRNETAELLQGQRSIQEYLSHQLNPYPSCWYIAKNQPSAESDYYWVQDGAGQAVKVYCDMDSHSLNSTRGWMRVANVDMTDPTQQCPPEFRLKTENGVRVCGRKGGFVGCTSTTFSSHGIEYGRVCGRIRAYQFGTPEAFEEGHRSIDDRYVDGISITHGSSPRKHIWTFVAARSEHISDANSCPCTGTGQNFTGTVPPFIGDDYFCDTAISATDINPIYILFTDDPLWDGQGCGLNSSCCSFNNPPWFCTQLPQPTTDDIELRMCGYLADTNEDTPFDQIELYIQNEVSYNLESLTSRIDSLLITTNLLTVAMSERVESLHDKADIQTRKLTNITHNVSPITDSIFAEVIRNETAELLRGQRSVQEYLSHQLNPYPSCWYIAKNQPSAESGYYWVQDGTGQAIKVYCDMDSHCCNSTRGWMRVANVNMTDPTQQCPPQFTLIITDDDKRTCGRPGPHACTSTTFPSHGIEYSRVCGRMRAYQFEYTFAFLNYHTSSGYTIDNDYVNGISITHGSSPRKHIWTFAAALSEYYSNEWACPCTQTDQNFTGTVPSFIGNDYFCDTAVSASDRYPISRTLSTDDPLWDGQGCGPTSSCCSFNNPPWFCTQLPQPTTDNIELRMCGHGRANIPFDQIELYVWNDVAIGKSNPLVTKTTEILQTQYQLQKSLTYLDPLPSCLQRAEAYPSVESGYYMVRNGTGQAVEVYCDMDSHCCNSTRGWMRVANVDMTDSTQQCPPEFILKTNNSVRVCGRKGGFVGCNSTTFSSHGIEYDRVCGRIRAYQFYSPNAFQEDYRSIDDRYVDGISITHGSSPRKHIWTFAAALSEYYSNSFTCPCTRTDLTFTGTIPSFIGNNYFCDTAVNASVMYPDLTLYTDDPLWDGQGCGPNSSCCSFNNPPWFCTQLPQPTTDDIELRMCGYRSNDDEDTPFDQIELYVQ